MKLIEQFEIYWVNLEPHQGSEQGGNRPCVILQTSAGGHVAKTFLVVPLTSSQLQKKYPHQVLVYKSAANGLAGDSKIKLDQIRVINRARLVEKIGTLEADYHPAVFEALDVIIDRFGDFRS